jgi:peptide/nickel transport system substrate-binding protein
MQKGDVKLKFKLSTIAGNDQYINMAQVAQQQWKAVGIQVDIEQLELATAVGNLNSNKYEAGIMGSTYQSSDMLVVQYGSKAIGGANRLNISDPTFDQLLMTTRTTLDPAKQQVAVNAAVKYLLDGAYMITFGTAKSYTAVNNRVKGFSISSVTNAEDLFSAYIVK